jgi:hypothetical protein
MNQVPHWVPKRNDTMKNSDRFRENADNCLHLAERTTSEASSKRYLRMAEAWRAVAKEQDWLDGEISCDEPTSKAAEKYPTSRGSKPNNR